MNGSINLTNGQLMSTADLGGRELLGMSGSLINYINTGVATTDSFQKNGNITQAQAKFEKKESAWSITLKAVGAFMLGAASAFGIYKGRNKIVPFIKKLPEYSHRLADFVESKIPSCSDIGNFFKKIFKKKS